MDDDHDLYLELLLRHQTEVKAFIGSILRDRQSRDDVFQEVALILWRKFGEFNRDQSFAAWARGIAANKVLHEIRQRNRIPALLDPTAVNAILNAFERIASESADRKQALSECLKLLPKNSRNLLALKYELDLPADEIGHRVHKNTDAVYQSLSRIRSKLAECIRLRLDLAGDVG